MPCYDHRDSPTWQHEMKLINLLNEIEGKRQADDYRTIDRDDIARKLCSFCKEHDVTQYSLELQIWWRDHQKSDAHNAAEGN